MEEKNELQGSYVQRYGQEKRKSRKQSEIEDGEGSGLYSIDDGASKGRRSLQYKDRDFRFLKSQKSSFSSVCYNGAESPRLSSGSPRALLRYRKHSDTDDEHFGLNKVLRRKHGLVPTELTGVKDLIPRHSNFSAVATAPIVETEKRRIKKMPSNAVHLTINKPVGINSEHVHGSYFDMYKGFFDTTTYRPEQYSKHRRPNLMYKRKRKRKKKGEITKEHKQYNVTYRMMVGIFEGIKRQHECMNGKAINEYCQKEIRAVKDLRDSKFHSVERWYHVPTSPALASSYGLKVPFKFKDYCPEVFHNLRGVFGIDDREYALSLSVKNNFIEFVSNSKSKQFFFYSNDGQFLIKTQSKSESRFARRILKDYYNYMMENPNSLVVRICGVHRLKVSGFRGKTFYFMVLQSVYSNAETREIHKVYDLKGSTLGRMARPGEAVLKDLDLRRNKVRFKLGPLKNEFLHQLKKDAEFLSDLNIMDYSLLVGIHSGEKSLDRHDLQRKASDSNSVPGRQVNITTGHKSRFEGSNWNLNPTDGVIVTLRKGYSFPTIAQERSLQSMPKQVLEGVVLGNQSQADISCNEESGFILSSSIGTISRTSSTSTKEADQHLPTFSKRALSCIEYGYHSDPENETSSFNCGFRKSKYNPIASSSSDGETQHEIYYFGIIDIMQSFNGMKRAESVLRKLSAEKGANASAVHPKTYATRFVNFISSHAVGD